MTPDEYNQKMFDNMRRRADQAESERDAALSVIEAALNCAIEEVRCLNVTVENLKLLGDCVDSVARAAMHERSIHEKYRALLSGEVSDE